MKTSNETPVRTVFGLASVVFLLTATIMISVAVARSVVR
jgi:hypothetical protein